MKIKLLLFSILLLTIIYVSAYSIQIPVCNNNLTLNCINYSNVTSINNASHAVLFVGEDGNLYLTNETPPYVATIYNYTSYNVTNVTYHYYNTSNGSISVYYNVTANETQVKEWLEKLYKNLSNIYNKTDVEEVFVNKSLFNESYHELKNITTHLYDYINNVNMTLVNNQMGNISFNVSEINDFLEDNSKFTLFWKFVIIINIFLLMVVIAMLIRMVSSG